MDEATEESTPRVWIGCLGCYNDGKLVGDWWPAIEAGSVVPSDLQPFPEGEAIAVHSSHEELWVMDHEYLPIKGECSPADAQRIAETVEAIKADGYPVAAVAAWWSNVNGGDFPDEWDAPTREEFEDAYAGEFDSFRDYADDLANQMIDAELAPASAPVGGDYLTARYFDYDAFARDLILGGDYWTEDAPGGRVYVFRAV